MRGIIDRFESDYAVVELDDRTMKNIKISLLPQGARNGDVIVEKDGVYCIDVDGTEKRKKNIEKLMDDLYT